MKYILGVLVTTAIMLTIGVGTAKAELQYEVINDIPVPFDLLMDIQGHWQGYAVNDVAKEGTGYRLRADRDSGTDDMNGFYLNFDSGWNYIGRKELPKPAPKPQTPKPAPTPAPKPQPQPERPERREDRNDDKPDKPDKPETPTPPVVIPPKPEEPEDDHGQGGGQG
jgi:hypothetical protein